MIPDAFKGAALPRSPEIYEEIADAIGCDIEVVQAVVTVEAAGKGFLADGRPKILHEKHVFHRLTGGSYDNVAPDISAAVPGGYQGGDAEYIRLGVAMELDPSAALRSCSWGLGQIMGFNYDLAGFATVEDYIADTCAGEDQQLRAFATFIRSVGLVEAMQRKDFVEFARRYNGPAYKRNAYDAKLLAAYTGAIGKVRDTFSPVHRGSISEIQALLGLAGYPVTVDGWPGPKTTAAIRQFQFDHGLQVDGIIGPQTHAALLLEAPTPPRQAA